MLLRRGEIGVLLNLVTVASEKLEVEADRILMTAKFRGFGYQFRNLY